MRVGPNAKRHTRGCPGSSGAPCHSNTVDCRPISGGGSPSRLPTVKRATAQDAPTSRAAPKAAITVSQNRRAKLDSSIGAPGFEPGTFWSQTRRATGLRYAPLALRVSNLTRPAPPSNGVMCKAPCCAAGCAALILTRSYRNGVHNGSSLLADGYGGLRRRPAGRGLMGRRLHGRGHTARLTPAGDGDPIHLVSVGWHAPAAGPPARVALHVHAHRAPRRAHGADLRHAARASRGDRAGRSGGASEDVSSVLTDRTGLAGPPHQHLDQRPNRPHAMRHALLRRHRRLGERHPEITRKEERIVSEAAAAAGLGEDPAVARCFDQLRLGERRGEICHHTTVARRALVVGHD